MAANSDAKVKEQANQGLSAKEAACGVDQAGKFEVQETDQETVVWAELPGFTESQLKLEIRGDRLTIRAGEFAKEIHVPPQTNPGQVRATFINGVLEVRVPKA